ncbi:MAG: anti-sigma factor antagonist [Opitutaceae bacterium]|nr:anti-sigma factor antagonist [Opitutaceae bacterium]
MALTAKLEIVNNVAKIALTGRLDASTANQFRELIEQAAAQKVKAAALLLGDLEYMASAGLRILVFARQKMGVAVKIYVVAPQDLVRETIEISGFSQAVILLPAYDATVIEG